VHLLIDWGGVLTTDVFASFSAFCESEGLPRDRVRELFAGDERARELLIGLESGLLAEDLFEQRLADVLGGVDPAGLIDRLFVGVHPEPTMLAAVRLARASGLRTGLISNSWSLRHYDRGLLSELFDGVVLSGEEGLRKPAARMYELGRERIGAQAHECVYVDDLGFNLKPPAAMGMTTILHVTPERTIAELETLLAVSLRET
jgi:epoxide hydrolase-like predicted phosphatase